MTHRLTARTSSIFMAPSIDSFNGLSKVLQYIRSVDLEITSPFKLASSTQQMFSVYCFKADLIGLSCKIGLCRTCQ